MPQKAASSPPEELRYFEVATVNDSERWQFRGGESSAFGVDTTTFPRLLRQNAM